MMNSADIHIDFSLSSPCRNDNEIRLWLKSDPSNLRMYLEQPVAQLLEWVLYFKMNFRLIQ